MRYLPHIVDMFSITKLMVALSWAVFLAGCAYVGFVSEMLKGVLPDAHRVVLSVGFILGAAALSRWIMAFDNRRNMRKIRRARSQRWKVG